MEYYSVIKKNKIMLFETTCLDLEIYIFSYVESKFFLKDTSELITK